MSITFHLLSPTDLSLLSEVYHVLSHVFAPHELDTEPELAAELTGESQRVRLLCVVGLVDDAMTLERDHWTDNNNDTERTEVAMLNYC